MGRASERQIKDEYRINATPKVNRKQQPELSAGCDAKKSTSFLVSQKIIVLKEKIQIL